MIWSEERERRQAYRNNNKRQHQDQRKEIGNERGERSLGRTGGKEGESNTVRTTKKAL